MKKEMINRFFNWINERHSIYLKRQAGEPWPWTEDEILQKYRFTNVFRELDTGTVWLRKNWREPFADSKWLFFNICLYRQFNRIETAEFLGYMVDKISAVDMLKPPKYEVSLWIPGVIAARLRDYKEHGNKIFTNAHMVASGTRNPETGERYKVKSDMMIHAILDPLWKNIEEFEPKPGDTLQTAYERLLVAPGFGPFVTYEVITDLRHTRYLEGAADIMTWASAGPGAKRGIHRLFGYPANLPRNDVNYLKCMQALLSLANSGYGMHVSAHVPKPLEMRDIEHSLCEFDKYERVRNGEGRPRRRFYKPI